MFCNFAVMFVIVYFCLIMWFSELYVSWACFKNYKEVLLLCQSTNMVRSIKNKRFKIFKYNWHGLAPLGLNWFYQDQCSKTTWIKVDKRNQWIHSGQGLIDSFDVALRHGGLMVSASSPKWAVQVWPLAEDTVLCSWARHLTLTGLSSPRSINGYWRIVWET